MSQAKRIVLIDDNDADNEFHQIMIREAGFAGEIVLIENPLHVLPFFEQADLSIGTYVFLDINMPMRDGFQVAEELTSIAHGRQTVVVMMLSSSSAQHDRERASRLPLIRDFIVKPLSAQKARELLEKPFAEFFR